MTTTTTTDLPDQILKLDALYAEQFTLQDELERRIEKFDGALNEIFAYSRSGIRLQAPYANSIITDFFERVESVAKALLSAPLAPFVPDARHRPEFEHHRVGGWDEATSRERTDKARHAVRPSVYWRILESKADPANQRAMASKKAARSLARMVGLLRAWGGNRNESFTPPPIVKGRLLIDDFPVYESTGFSSSTVKVSGMAQEYAAAMVFALDDAESDNLEVAEELQRVLRKLDHNWTFSSREAFDLGDGASLVTFKRAAKLYLPTTIGDVINLFISEHLADELNPASAA